MATIEGLKGSLYQRGGVWWIKYRQHGRVIRESSKSADRRVAEKLLLKRNAALDEGRTINPHLNTCKVERLLKLVIADQGVREAKDAAGVERRIRKHLMPAFGWRPAAAVTTETVAAYIAARRATGAAAATVNRELSALSRAYRLGREARLVDQAPPIKKLREDNARSGFFKRADVERVIAHLSPVAGANVHLPALLRFAYLTGWRRGELLGLQWRQVDMDAGTIRLAAGTTKNGQGRVFPMTPEIREILTAQLAHTRQVERARGLVCPHVFHRHGKPLTDFYTAWRQACRAAGLPGRLFHDFRRSAARNLALAGVSEQMAMQFTGHATNHMYRRYNIMDEANLSDAAAALGRYQEAEAARLSSGHNPGTVALLDREREAASS